MNSVLILFLFTFTMGIATAQNSILGKWKTISSKTGTARSVVEIGERNGKIYGKVIKIFSRLGEDPDPVCLKCSTEDPRFNKKIIGMEVLKEMVKIYEGYTGGSILDPEVGVVYRCTIWREGNELKVRGYVGPFFRTQTWVELVP